MGFSFTSSLLLADGVGRTGNPHLGIPLCGRSAEDQSAVLKAAGL